MWRRLTVRRRRHEKCNDMPLSIQTLTLARSNGRSVDYSATVHDPKFQRKSRTGVEGKSRRLLAPLLSRSDHFDYLSLDCVGETG